MKIKVGDTVKFLNEIGGGIVKKIIDEKTVSVLTSDDFEVPTLINQLIKVDKTEGAKAVTTNVNTETKLSGLKKESKSKEQSKYFTDLEPEEEDFDENETDIDNEEFDDDDDDDYLKPTDEIDLYLAYVPEDKKNITDSNLDAYIINDSNYFAAYIYLKEENGTYISSSGILEPNTKDIIEKLKRTEINKLSSVAFQFIFWKQQPHAIKPMVEKKMKIGTARFFQVKSYTSNDFFDTKAIILPIYEENKLAEAIKQLTTADVEKIITEKEIKNKKINTPKQFTKIDLVKLEIDLHIHELVENTAGLEPKDILEIQMDKFRNELNAAILSAKVAKIIFIHGIGNGTLKTEVRRELDTKYKKYKYQDASFKEYGYGATMVFLK